MVRASYRSQVDYVGNWLPEPPLSKTARLLAEMLANDVRLTADDGKAATIMEVLEGGAVLAFLEERLSGRWAAHDWNFTDLDVSID